MSWALGPPVSSVFIMPPCIVAQWCRREERVPLPVAQSAADSAGSAVASTARATIRPTRRPEKKQSAIDKPLM